MSRTATIALEHLKGLPWDLRGVMSAICGLVHEVDPEHEYKRLRLTPEEGMALKKDPTRQKDSNGHRRHWANPEHFDPTAVTLAFLREYVTGVLRDDDPPPMFDIDEDTIGRMLAVLAGEAIQWRARPDKTEAERKALPRDERYITLATPLLTKHEVEGRPTSYSLNLVPITDDERAAYKERYPRSNGTRAVKFPPVEWRPCGPSEPKRANDAKKARATTKADQQAAKRAEDAERIERLQALVDSLEPPAATQVVPTPPVDNGRPARQGPPAATQVEPPAATQVPTCVHAGPTTCVHAGHEVVLERGSTEKDEGRAPTATRPVAVAASSVDPFTITTRPAVSQPVASTTGSDRKATMTEQRPAPTAVVKSDAERVLAAARGMTIYPSPARLEFIEQALTRHSVETLIQIMREITLRKRNPLDAWSAFQHDRVIAWDPEVPF